MCALYSFDNTHVSAVVLLRCGCCGVGAVPTSGTVLPLPCRASAPPETELLQNSLLTKSHPHIDSTYVIVVFWLMTLKLP